MLTTAPGSWIVWEAYCIITPYISRSPSAKSIESNIGTPWNELATNCVPTFWNFLLLGTESIWKQHQMLEMLQTYHKPHNWRIQAKALFNYSLQIWNFSSFGVRNRFGDRSVCDVTKQSFHDTRVCDKVEKGNSNCSRSSIRASNTEVPLWVLDVKISRQLMWLSRNSMLTSAR